MNKILTPEIRPIELCDIKGQDTAVTELLDLKKNGTSNKHIGLFGPSGTGKTSTALAFAKALQCDGYNWDKRQTCGTCHGCSTKKGHYLDHYDCPNIPMGKGLLEVISIHSI